MTLSCDPPVVWGKYGNEEGYWQAKLVEVGIPVTKGESISSMKRKFLKAKKAILDQEKDKVQIKKKSFMDYFLGR